MQAHLIIYVANQTGSRDFYQQVLQQEPRLDVVGMTEFILNQQCILGLMPHASIQRLLQVKSQTPAQVMRAEIYLQVDCPETWYARALQAGATPLSPPQARDWGDMVGYCADPDGHVLGFARPHPGSCREEFGRGNQA